MPNSAKEAKVGGQAPRRHLRMYAQTDSQAGAFPASIITPPASCQLPRPRHVRTIRASATHTASDPLSDAITYSDGRYPGKDRKSHVGVCHSMSPYNTMNYDSYEQHSRVGEPAMPFPTVGAVRPPRSRSSGLLG